MKESIQPAYIFDASLKKLDLSDIANFDITKLYLVINLTQQAVIYEIGKKGLGYSSVSNSVITLQYNTTSHADTDILFIMYENVDTTITGYSLEATQLLIKNLLTSIDGKDFATEATLDLVKTAIESVNTTLSGGIDVNNFPTDYAKESGGNLATIAGKDFATSAKQDTINTSIGAVNTSVGTTNTTLTSTNTKLDTINTTLTGGIGVTVSNPVSSVSVSNFPVTQPVSGTVAFSNTSIDVGNFPASQTVSGTVTANIGTSGSLALDASLGTINTSIGTTNTTLTTTNDKLDTLHTDLGTTIHNDLNTTLHGDFTTLNAKDFATQTTLASLLSYEANQTATGTITVTNSNLNSGTATANSTVTFGSALNKKSAVRAVIAGGGSGTSNALLGQVSYDNATWYNVSSFVSGASASFSANGSFSVTAASSQVVDFITGGMPYFRITASAAGTSGATVSMVAVATNPYIYSTLTPKNAAGNGQTTMANSLPVVLPSDQTVANNISQVNGTTISSQTEPVSSQALLPVMLMGDSGYTFSSSNNVASSGGTLDLSTIKGANYEAGIYLTALSGGTSPSIDFKLQTLRLNGTSDYQDIWHCERITAINNYVYIPPQLLSGGKRLTWTTNGSPATATMTINSRCNSGNNPIRRQFFNRSTNLLNGTLNATSSSYNISGCQIINAQFTCETITSGVAAYYQLQVSYDNSNWESVGTAVQAVASSAVKLTASIDGSYNFARILCQTGATGTQNGTFGLISGKGV